VSTSRQPDVIHEDAWITIWHHPLLNIVHHRIHQPLRGEVFRRALQKGSEVLERYRASKWLSDDRLHFVLPQADQEWAASVWFPATRQAGWKYWAIVKPELAVADLYMRRIAAGWSAAGVKTELFPTPEAGLGWLARPDGNLPSSRVLPPGVPSSSPRRIP
jgi:hypothetical protein